MTSRARLHFASRTFETLDNFALAACQQTCLGNSGNWFLHFRNGLYGFYARLFGVRRHDEEIHAWAPRIRPINERDYQVATLLFHMDSALECLVYALNALGFGARPDAFLSVEKEETLKKVKPANVVGTIAGKKPTQGYGDLFPTFQQLWLDNADNLRFLFEAHDRSKHREQLYGGGRLAVKPPPGFYQRLGLQESSLPLHAEALIHPDEIIHISRRPFSPGMDAQWEGQPIKTLEQLIDWFVPFINDSGARALADARQHIQLSDPSPSDSDRPFGRLLDC